MIVDDAGADFDDFLKAVFWWAGHTAAHMFFVVKAVNWAGGSGEADFSARPDALNAEFEF
jgi:hypothetical protein